jgi:hypothetical protein
LEGRISSTSIGQRKQAQGGVMKSLGKDEFRRSFSCVIFLGKGRRRRMSLGRWCKEGEWIGGW